MDYPNCSVTEIWSSLDTILFSNQRRNCSISVITSSYEGVGTGSAAECSPSARPCQAQVQVRQGITSGSTNRWLRTRPICDQLTTEQVVVSRCRSCWARRTLPWTTTIGHELALRLQTRNCSLSLLWSSNARAVTGSPLCVATEANQAAAPGRSMNPSPNALSSHLPANWSVNENSHLNHYSRFEGERRVRSGLRRPARTGCGTRTRATRSPAACRSRSRSRTSGMHHWPPRRSM